MSRISLKRRSALVAINATGGRKVLKEILENGPQARIQIAQSTGLTETSVSRIAQKLISSGVIHEEKQVNSRTSRGRPPISLRFSNNYFVVGIGVRGYAQWVEVRQFGGELIDIIEFTCGNLTDPTAVLARCCDELLTLLKAQKIPLDRVLHLGVLIVGVVDPALGTVLRAENLGWRRVEIKEILSGLIDIPVSVEAMLNGMNLQHQIESSPRPSNAVLVSVALGIGASIIANNRILTGSSFAAGQLGHMRSMSSRLVCVCGRTGCLDTIASGRALLRTNGLTDNTKSLKKGEFAKLFRQFSADAQSRPELAEQLAAAGKEVGRAVGAAIPLIDCERITFTGFVVDDDYFFDAVLDELLWYGIGSSAQRVQCLRYQQAGEGAPTFFACLSLTNEDIQT